MELPYVVVGWENLEVWLTSKGVAEVDGYHQVVLYPPEIRILRLNKVGVR